MPKVVSDELLNKAAELRAGGAKWDAVARALHRAVTTVSEWPRRFPDRWPAALKAAEEQALGEGSAESLLVLRNLLRHPDPKIARDAAKLLSRLHLDRSKLERAADLPKPFTSDGARLAAFLDGKPDDELARHFADLSPERAPPPHASPQSVDIAVAI